MSKITIDRAVLERALEAWAQARGALAYVAVGNAPSNPNLARSTCSQAVWVLDNAEPALRAALDQSPSSYPLPDELYDSKDWRAGGYAERVEWLHTMYESAKEQIVVLSAALEHPQVEQEPYAWMSVGGAIWRHKTCADDVPLYTHLQPPRQPLTDDEIEKLFPYTHEWLYEIGLEEATKFARSIEAAHGIGGEA